MSARGTADTAGRAAPTAAFTDFITAFFQTFISALTATRTCSAATFAVSGSLLCLSLGVLLLRVLGSESSGKVLVSALTAIVSFFMPLEYLASFSAVNNSVNSASLQARMRARISHVADVVDINCVMIIRSCLCHVLIRDNNVCVPFLDKIVNNWSEPQYMQSHSVYFSDKRWRGMESVGFVIHRNFELIRCVRCFDAVGAEPTYKINS